MTDEFTVKVLRQIRDDIAKLDAKMDTRFDETNKRIDGLEMRTMVVETILRDVHGGVLILNRRVNKLDKKVGDLDKSVGDLDKTVGNLNRRVSDVEKKID